MRFILPLIVILWSQHLRRVGASAAKVQEALDEGVNMWVVSSGGVGSEMLVVYIKSNFPLHTNHQRSNLDWVHDDYLSHAPRPVHLKNPHQLKAVVYIVGNPLLALCSMKRRGVHVVNLNKLHNYEVVFTYANYSDEELLKAIYYQFKNWTQDGVSWKFGYPVHVLSSEDIYHEECLDAFLPGNHVISRKRRSRSPETIKCTQSLRFSTQVFQFVNEMLEFRSSCTRQRMLNDSNIRGSGRMSGLA